MAHSALVGKFLSQFIPNFCQKGGQTSSGRSLDSRYIPKNLGYAIIGLMWMRFNLGLLGSVLAALSAILIFARHQPAQTPLIYFTSNRSGMEQIYRMKPDGSQVQQLTKGNHHHLLDISPDGTLLISNSFQIYWGHSLGNLKTFAIQTRDAHLWGEDRLLVESGYLGFVWFELRSEIFYPADFPDGEIPVLAPDQQGWVMGVLKDYFYHLSVDGRLITQGIHQNLSPSWSQDGEWITFSSDETGDYELYKIRPDGSERTRLSDSSGWDGNAQWSPNGEWIAFNSNRNGESDIYLMRPDGTELHRLTDSPAIDMFPFWIPPQERSWQALPLLMLALLLFNYALFTKHINQFFHQIRRHPP